MNALMAFPGLSVVGFQLGVGIGKSLLQGGVGFQKKGALCKRAYQCLALNFTHRF